MYGLLRILRYIRIIKDFYLAELDPTKRPKVFGMTASPVDAKVDVVQAAKYAQCASYPLTLLKYV